MKLTEQNVLQTRNASSSAWSAGVRWAIVLSLVFLAGHCARAASFSWIAASNYYTNPAAWNPAILPVAGDTATIGNATVANATVLFSDPVSPHALASLLMGAVAGTSLFTMSDGALLITNGSTSALQLGNASGANETFTQNGGTLVVARPSTSSLYYQDSFYPGNASGAKGTFTINNGSLAILCGLEIGNSGSGTFNINGGTVVDNGWFGLRAGGTSTDSGTFNMTGGTLYVLRNTQTEGQSYSGLALGQSGYKCTANISGGTAYFKKIAFGNVSTVNETLNMSGGSIYLGYQGVQRVGASASQTINISGGTFHTVDMQVITTTANCGNTNTVLSDGTNWTWDANLPVNLMNSTFLVNGSSGPGYVTFAPEATRTITLSNVWSGVGGLTFNGPGTNVLAGVNTYTGGTTLSQGTLAFSGNGSIVDSTLTIPSGATVAFASATPMQSYANNFTGGGNVAVIGNAYLSGSLTYSGQTLISAGALVLGPSTTLANTPLISLAAGGWLDASMATAGLTIGSGQTVSGSGTLAGEITAGSGSILAPGTSLTASTLTVSNNLTLNNNSTNVIKLSSTPLTIGSGVNDLIGIGGNLTVNGTAYIEVVPLGTLDNANSYTAMQYNLYGSGNLTFNPGAQLVAVCTNPRYTITVDTNLAGSIQLNVTGQPSKLLWQGDVAGSETLWDYDSTTNWVNLNTSTRDYFVTGDTVCFDDSRTPDIGVTQNVRFLPQGDSRMA